MTRIQFVGLFVSFSALVLAPLAGAQCDGQQPPWAAEAGAQHGTAIDIAGSIMVIGAPEHSQPGLGAAGAVTVSRKVGASWTSSQLPLPTLLGAGDRFGHAVAIDENATTIVAGAPFNDAAAGDGGLLTIYEWQAGSQTWALVAEWPGIFPAGLFGGAVDISGDVIAVGEPTGAFGNGTVNLYRRTAPSTWTHEAFFAGVAFLDGMGWAVALHGDRLAIGSPFYDVVGGLDEGRIEFFERVGGSWIATNSYDGDESESHFGSSVAMYGDNALVGAPDRDAGAAVDVGVTYFMHWTGSFWENTNAWTHGGTGQHFGSAVAIHGGRAMVSSPDAPGAFGTGFGAQSGHVSLWGWSGTGWDNPKSEFYTASDVAAGDRFGTALAMGATYVAAGAAFADGVGADSGKAYVHDLSIGATILDHGNALAGSLGAPSLAGNGACCGNTTVQFDVTGAAPSTAAYMVIGLNSFFHAFKGGVMVPHPDAIVGAFLTDGTGRLTLAMFWPPGLPSISLWAQFWLVDASGPLGFTATNGLQYVSPGG